MSPSLTPATRERLRIAIQKSGRLAEPARTLLAACGLSWRESRDKLFCYGESLPVDLLLVRDDDIPGLIADGVCDFGIVGRNELDEQAGERALIGRPQAYRELRPLGFGNCRACASPPAIPPCCGSGCRRAGSMLPSSSCPVRSRSPPSWARRT